MQPRGRLSLNQVRSDTVRVHGRSSRLTHLSLLLLLLLLKYSNC